NAMHGTIRPVSLLRYHSSALAATGAGAHDLVRNEAGAAPLRKGSVSPMGTAPQAHRERWRAGGAPACNFQKISVFCAEFLRLFQNKFGNKCAPKATYISCLGKRHSWGRNRMLLLK